MKRRAFRDLGWDEVASYLGTTPPRWASDREFWLTKHGWGTLLVCDNGGEFNVRRLSGPDPFIGSIPYESGDLTCCPIRIAARFHEAMTGGLESVDWAWGADLDAEFHAKTAAA